MPRISLDGSSTEPFLGHFYALIFQRGQSGSPDPCRSQGGSNLGGFCKALFFILARSLPQARGKNWAASQGLSGAMKRKPLVGREGCTCDWLLPVTGSMSVALRLRVFCRFVRTNDFPAGSHWFPIETKLRRMGNNRETMRFRSVVFFGKLFRSFPKSHLDGAKKEVTASCCFAVTYGRQRTRTSDFHRVRMAL